MRSHVTSGPSQAFGKELCNPPHSLKESDSEVVLHLLRGPEVGCDGGLLGQEAPQGTLWAPVVQAFSPGEASPAAVTPRGGARGSVFTRQPGDSDVQSGWRAEASSQPPAL